MDLPREQSEKLIKYFINADPFLWGLLYARNKKDRIKELKDMGFLATYKDGGNPVYDKIKRDLLIEIGIDGILEKIVIPRVVSIFGPEDLRYFSDCWDQGRLPDINYLIRRNLYHSRIDREDLEASVSGRASGSLRDPAFIFVQIDTQHHFVERWTVFAGLWFEEIDRYLDDVGQENFRGFFNVIKSPSDADIIKKSLK